MTFIKYSFKNMFIFLLCISMLTSSLVFAPENVQAADMGEETAQNLYNSIKSSYQATTYEDFFNLLNPYVYSTEKLSIQTQLTKELGRTPTDDEVQNRIAQIYMDRLGMRSSFESVMGQLDSLMPKILANSNSTTATYLETNKNRILFGLTYLEKYYSFCIDGTAGKDILLYTPQILGIPKQDALTIVSSIGNINYTNAKANKTSEVYTNYLSWITGIDDVADFVDALASTSESNVSSSEFFKQTSKAVIKEVGSGSDFFIKAKSDARIKEYLLPLLNLSSESIYIISTSHTTTIGLTSTYGGADSADFNTKLATTAASQQSFLDFWKRISQTSDSLKMSPELILIDTLAIQGTEGQSVSQRWSAEYGSSADPGVAEFITPLGYYRTYMFAGAEADTNGNLIQFFVDHVLTDTGVNTYTHELTHIYDQSVWLNGLQRRTNIGNETFARGLFESENNTQQRDGGNSAYAPFFNLNTAYELDDNRIQNQSPQRFQTEYDLQQYMQGVMDIVYTLDILEAEEILKMSDADKAILLNRVSLVDDPTDTKSLGRKLDCFSNITEEEAAVLLTIDDLVDQNIVSGRLIPKGSTTTQTVTYNDYVVVPMFEGVYAGIQNPNGAVGDFLFRRYAHELLGEYGWQDGFLAYISNQYENDNEALANILPSEYKGSLSAFKKMMYKRRSANMADLKATESYADSDEMRQAISDALQKDLAAIKEGIKGGTTYYMLNVKEVQNVKADIFKEYLLMTNDFKTSVYETKDTDTPPTGDDTDDTEDTGDTEETDDVEGTDDTEDTDDQTPIPPAKNAVIINQKTGVSYKVTTSSLTKGTVTYYKPKNKKIKVANIPNTITIDGIKYKVTGIAKNAFKGCTKLKKVTIGKNIATIGTKAFYGCRNLKTIKIKTTNLKLGKVGKKAFKGIHAKAMIKVPKKKYKSYRTILKKRGVGKKAIIKKF